MSEKKVDTHQSAGVYSRFEPWERGGIVPVSHVRPGSFSCPLRMLGAAALLPRLGVPTRRGGVNGLYVCPFSSFLSGLSGPFWFASFVLVSPFGSQPFSLLSRHKNDLYIDGLQNTIDLDCDLHSTLHSIRGICPEFWSEFSHVKQVSPTGWTGISLRTLSLSYMSYFGNVLSSSWFVALLCARGKALARALSLKTLKIGVRLWLRPLEVPLRLCDSSLTDRDLPILGDFQAQRLS